MTLMNVRLREALETLSKDCSAMRALVQRGNSVPWFGSGISRERFPGLDTLIEQLLAKLFYHADSTNPSCPYRAALAEVLALAPRETTCVPEVEPAHWDSDQRKKVIKALVSNYANVLQVSVQTSPNPKSIRWDIMDLITIYSDPSIEPDAEHQFIVTLILEGIWPQSVTTNWDALIEKADTALSDGARRPLFSVACPEDLASMNGSSAQLFKIHGCAVKSAADRGRYSQFLVATDVDIGRWGRSPQASAFREVLAMMIRSKAMLFIGLSGQDFNLKQQIIASECHVDYDSKQPKIAFATSEITSHHKTILMALYSESVYNDHQQEISRQAKIPLYGKPLLGALWVDLILQKARVIVSRGVDMRASSKSMVWQAIDLLEELLCSKFDDLSVSRGIDEGWRWLASEVPPFLSRCIETYRRQQSPSSPATYFPLVPGDLSNLEADQNLPLLRFHWLLWAVSLLVHGQQSGAWTVSTWMNGLSGALPLGLGRRGRVRPLIVAAAPAIAVMKCVDNGLLDEISYDSAIVLYPGEKRPRTPTRSPISSFRKRTTGAGPTEIWLGDIYDETGSDEEALKALLMEVA